jgi:zinc-ribbon domain
MPRIPRYRRREAPGIGPVRDGGEEQLTASDQPSPAPDASPTADLAAGPLEAPAPEGENFRERGRLRRRLRYLRRLREIALRDLGGLVYDLHRYRRDRPELVEGKLGTLDAIDRELRVIEQALDAHQPVTVLREAGIAACVRCGALLSSDSRFCSNCGMPLDAATSPSAPDGAAPAAPPQPGAAEHAPPEPHAPPPAAPAARTAPQDAGPADHASAEPPAPHPGAPADHAPAEPPAPHPDAQATAEHATVPGSRADDTTGAPQRGEDA